MTVLKRKLNRVRYPTTTRTVTESYQHCSQVPPASQPVTNPGTGPSTDSPAAPNPGTCFIIDKSDSLTTDIGGVYLGNGRYKVCMQSPPPGFT